VTPGGSRGFCLEPLRILPADGLPWLHLTFCVRAGKHRFRRPAYRGDDVTSITKLTFPGVRGGMPATPWTVTATCFKAKLHTQAMNAIANEIFKTSI